MFQCLGLGSVETGGCGEDWWHPECLIGLSRDWNKTEAAKEMNGDGEAEKKPPVDDDDETPLPPNFPDEDDFETFLCYKCVESNPWLKRYAGTPGFLPAVFKDGGLAKATELKPAADTNVPESEAHSNGTLKRKADDETEEAPAAKKTKEEEPAANIPPAETQPSVPPKPKHTSLPSSSPSTTFSLFLKEDFRDHFCRCPDCYPNLAAHPQLREEEESYQPPLSEDGEADGPGSAGTRSLLDRGEAAFSNMDRVRAIEGAMVYNKLRDNLKEFLKPYAESGQAVSADDIKSYFEKLRGDDQGIKDAAGQASAARDDGGNGDGNGNGEGDDNRREQSGMLILVFVWFWTAG